MELKFKRKFIGLFLIVLFAVNLNSLSLAAYKPYAASILIDYSTEMDLENYSAITKDFSALFYMQASPIIIFGQHLLFNLFQKTKFLKSKYSPDLKYFIEVKNAINNFDKNWIGVEILGNQKSYILIPKKYIEHYFNLDLSFVDGSLMNHLENYCKQGKIIHENFVCRTVADLFFACGFEFYKGFKYKFVRLNDLLKLKDNQELTYYDDFYLNIKNVLSNTLSIAKDEKKWHLFLDGHGWTGYKNKGEGKICNLPEKYFNPIFENICMKNVAWVFMDSCYLGGSNRRLIEFGAKKMYGKGKCPCIVLKSSTDTTSRACGINEILSTDVLEKTKKLDLIIFEPKDSVTTYGLCCVGLLHNSFFRNQNFRELLFYGAIRYLDKENNYLIVSNWPLILDPNKKLEFEPLENENYVYLINEKNANNINLQTNGQDIVFLDCAFVKRVKFMKKIPYLLSLPADSYVHIIEKVDATNFDIDMKKSLEKLFMDKYVQVACSKEFLIKELILGKNKYLNIYVNQFYEGDSKKHVTDIIWRDVVRNKVYYNQYIYADNDKNIKDKQKEDWYENFSKELSVKDVAEYEKVVKATEKYVINGFCNA